MLLSAHSAQDHITQAMAQPAQDHITQALAQPVQDHITQAVTQLKTTLHTGPGTAT